MWTSQEGLKIIGEKMIHDFIQYSPLPHVKLSLCSVLVFVYKGVEWVVVKFASITVLFVSIHITIWRKTIKYTQTWYVAKLWSSMWCHTYISKVSCQKGPICHAWRVGPFWQNTIDIKVLHVAKPLYWLRLCPMVFLAVSLASVSLISIHSIIILLSSDDAWDSYLLTNDSEFENWCTCCWRQFITMSTKNC